MSARRHIVIAVTPVLLGDTLSRSLNSEETEVTVITAKPRLPVARTPMCSSSPVSSPT